MAIEDDFSVAANGDIRYTGGGTTYTVLELHRFLQDLADDAVASGDDLLDITDDTPSDRATDNIISLINGYNIDDNAAEYLFDGSITQDNGDTFYRGLVVVGSVETGTEIQIVQNNAILTSYWGSGLNADAAANILLRIIVKTRQDGANIDGERIRVFARELGDTYAEFSVTMGAGNNTAALFTGADLNNATDAATIGTYDQFTNVEGFQQLDVDGNGTDEDYYSQWTVTGGGSTPSSPGINDLYEWSKYIQRRGTTEVLHGLNGALFRGITNQWGYDTVVGTEVTDNDWLAWGTFLEHGAVSGGPFVVGEKITGGTSGAIGRVLSVDNPTTSLVVATESGTFASGETITGFTSSASATLSVSPVGQSTGGGVAVVLAADQTNDIVWIQLLKGTTPADNAVCYNADPAEGSASDHTSSIAVNGSVTSRTLPATLIGVSTGSAIIGGFGIGIDPTDLTQNDQLFDLTNTLRVPPNNVTFTVSGLVSGEDYVLVGPATSGDLDTNQLTLNAALTTDNITAIQFDASLPDDTPSSGTVRVFDNDGVARRLEYGSISTTTLTNDTLNITSTDGNEDFGTVNADITNDVFLSYIDELAAGTSADYTAVYSADRDLFVRVRDGGSTPIRTFETPATLTSSGGSATAIRTSDA